MKPAVIVVTVEGMPVRVLLDEHGRPAMVSAWGWAGGDYDRIARLAIHAAGMQIDKAAKDAARTKRSTEEKRKKALDHWSLEWLKAAHVKYPRYRAARLAREAQKLVAMNCKGNPEFEKRDEINKHRALRYLKTLAPRS